MRLKSLLPLLGVLAVLCAWEGVVRLFAVPDIIAPEPTAILRSLWLGISSGIFLQHTLITAEEAVIGFVLALLSGVAVGALVAEIRVIDKAAYPLIVAFQAMPKVALAPL